MGKKLFLFAAAAVALASCTETDLSGDTSFAKESTSDAIQFSAKTGNAGTTRAGFEGDLTNSNIKDANAGFGVFGYHSGKDDFTTWSSWNPSTPTASTKVPNFMYNEKLTWNDTKKVWDYSPVKYWPNGIDAANEDGKPSNTATEANAQNLSFFAYAPYVKASATAYATDNTFVGGDLPAGVTAAVFTGDAAPTAVQNGIVAMSKNSDPKDMHVKYILNPSSAKNFVDLTWGLRGTKVYAETDKGNNTTDELGNEYNVNLTKQNVGEKVTFLFKHALARVGGNTSKTTAASGKQICGLWVVADIDANSTTDGAGTSSQGTYFTNDFSNTKTLITIKEVKIRDKYTYTHEDSETSNDENSDFLTEGWFDIMNGKWYDTKTETAHTTGNKGVLYEVTAKNEPTGNEFKLNPDIKEGTVNNSTGVDWQATTAGDPGYTGGATGVALTKKAIYEESEDVPGLLLIPGESGNNTLYVTVEYVVRTADSKLSTGYTEVTQRITNKVTLANTILDPNKYYNLVMHLGLTSVKFEAVVADWSNGDDKYDEDGKEVTPGTGTDNSVWLPSNVVYAQTTASPYAATKNTTTTVFTKATTTEYKIDVANLTENNTVEVAYSGVATSATADPTTIAAAGTTQVTVALPVNTTKENKLSTITITEKNSGAVVTTTTVHIIQNPAE